MFTYFSFLFQNVHLTGTYLLSEAVLFYLDPESAMLIIESAHFWSVGDRIHVFNTVVLIYRYDMSSGLQ